MARMPAPKRNFRKLPSIDRLLSEPSLLELLAELPRTLVVEAARFEVAAARARVKQGDQADVLPISLALRAATRARAWHLPQLRRVLNATGVVLHTNLGRAPLAEAARRAVEEVARGYSSLELDLTTGRRGERGTGVARWIVLLSGAEAALAVNNGAGAVLLSLSALAAGGAVVVSRGELVEIGGSFRVPDILEKSGARLIEVGTTNRTHLSDYERALDKGGVAAILRVHQSNFRIEGFTTRPALKDLAALARRRRVPLIEDLGSGALLNLRLVGLAHEPTVGESIAAGVDVVTFSGDKLLGGSQAGLIAGRRRYLERIARDPLARALRLDKLALAALEATLPLLAEPERAAREIPALSKLCMSDERLRERAERLAAAVRALNMHGLEARVVPAIGEVGGGALPLRELPGWAVEVSERSRTAIALRELARAGDPPVIGIVRRGGLQFDPRTLSDAELDELPALLERAWNPVAGDA